MLRIAHALIGPEGAHAAGRQLLETLYRQETGLSLPPIEKERRGKPYFAEGGYHFSISHTKHHVFCALSDAPVGIDAEELSRQVPPRLAEKVLSESELAYYQSASDPNRTLLTFWVLKEAQGKLTGEGINGFPNRTAFTPDDPRVTETHNCLLAVIQRRVAADNSR